MCALVLGYWYKRSVTDHKLTSVYTPAVSSVCLKQLQQKKVLIIELIIDYISQSPQFVVLHEIKGEFRETKVLCFLPCSPSYFSVTECQHVLISVEHTE